MLQLALAVALTHPTDQALATWFGRGRCTPAATTGAPFARNPDEGIVGSLPASVARWQSGVRYWYDARHGLAESVSDESGGLDVIRAIGAPPATTPTADLGKIATTSGVRIGSPAATVVRLLGKPKAVTLCGAVHYVYLVDKGVGGNPLEFTIRNGRVVEILRYFGD